MRMLLFCLLLLGASCSSGVPGGEVSAPSSTPDPRLPPLEALTVEWGCGHGFWVSDSRQGATLRLSYVGSGQPSPTTRLPHADWQATFSLGEDLYANWCDDVIEPHEPSPVVHRSFEVVAGTLVIVGEVPPDHTGGELSVEARDLVVELSDGSRVPLGSLTITNPYWGTFAG